MASGYFEANAGGNSSQQKWKLRLAYDYSTNIQGTQTTITWTLSIYDGTGDSAGTNSYWMTSYSGTRSAYYNYSSIGWYTLGSFTDTYSMTPGVARTITANAAWNTDNTGSSYTPPSISLSESLTFPAVGGTASISCSSGLVGGSVVASIGRKTTNFTYNLALTVGATTLNYSGINADSYTINLPTSLYNQFTTCTSRTCTITCQTMYGNTQIGDTQSANLTVGIDTSANIPSISLSVYDSNSTTTALTGNSSKLIKGYSNAYCVISASATNGASIPGYTVTCADGKSFNGDSGTLTGVESGSFTGYITDSRGLGNSASVNKTLIDYTKLTLTPTITPPDNQTNIASIKFEGNYWNGNFGAVANTLTLKYRYNKDGAGYSSWVTVSGTPTLSNGTYSLTVSVSGLPYTSSYVFDCYAVDKLVSKTVTQNVRTIPVFDIKKNNMAINVSLKVQGKSLIDWGYPVGAVYISTVSTSPASLFGGTWEQIKGRFLLAAYDTNEAGTTGGEASHTLSTEEMPSHFHNAYSGYTGGGTYFDAYSAKTGYTESVIPDGYTAPTTRAGGGQPHNNMPPYLAVYMWKRIA